MEFMCMLFDIQPGYMYKVRHQIEREKDRFCI